MPFLGIAERRLAAKLGAVATRGERDAEPPLRVPRRRGPDGLLGNTLFGLGGSTRSPPCHSAVAIKEGRASWRGEGCCAAC
jgi:hypothetical protein